MEVERCFDSSFRRMPPLRLAVRTPVRDALDEGFLSPLDGGPTATAGSTTSPIDPMFTAPSPVARRDLPARVAVRVHQTLRQGQERVESRHTANARPWMNAS